MSAHSYSKIIDLLDANSVEHVSFEHEACKTSNESRAVRTRAGYPNAVGAKALLTKLYFSDGEKFATIVLPGDHILDKNSLIAGIPGLKRMRFVTPQEMAMLAKVVPGCMPPFASQIFPDIPLLILAKAIESTEELGFNAADLQKSIILKTKDYLSIVEPSFVVDCSEPKNLEG